MKNKYTISSTILLFFFMVANMLSCRQASADKELPVISNADMITSDPLPPGRQVLEDGAVINAEDNKTVALGRNSSIKEKPVTDAAPDRTAYLKKKFKNLLVFHADDTMEVNAPKLATLILSRDESIEKLKIEVLDESDAQDSSYKSDTTIELGSKMKARLIAFGSSKTENSFTIEPLGDEIQSFRNDRKKILWQWKITPLKPGQQELKLSIQIIEKDGEAVSLPARNIQVTIFAKQDSVMSKVGDFITNKYEFLITAIMIPIMIAWFTTRIKNRNAQNNPAPKKRGKA